MSNVRLVVWNEKEAAQYAAELRDKGFDVEQAPVTGTGVLQNLRAAPPQAIVIHLGRLPSHGREVAMAIRSSKVLREIPIVFAGGDPAKVDAIREKLPDAAYASWEKIGATLKRVLKAPPKPVVFAKSSLDAYAGTPLAKKLGIKEGSRVLLVDAPRSFFSAVEPLPERVEWIEDSFAPRDLAILFVESVGALARQLPGLREPSPVWVAWKKGNVTDVRDNIVREMGLSHGLVDYKVCSIDAKWSGYLFRLKKQGLQYK